MSMYPATGNQGTSNLAGNDNRDSSREANLAAVRVTAQQEIETKALGFFEGLRAVGEENAAGMSRNMRAHTCEIVSFVVVGVVNAGDPERGVVFFNFQGLVEQEGQTGLLKFWHHFNEVVVAKDRAALPGEPSDNAARFLHASRVAAIHGVSEISSDHGKIMWSTA